MTFSQRICHIEGACLQTAAADERREERNRVSIEFALEAERHLISQTNTRHAAYILRSYYDCDFDQLPSDRSDTAVAR